MSIKIQGLGIVKALLYTRQIKPSLKVAYMVISYSWCFSDHAFICQFSQYRMYIAWQERGMIIFHKLIPFIINSHIEGTQMVHFNHVELPSLLSYRILMFESIPYLRNDKFTSKMMFREGILIF